jgi:predicted amidohydrolase
MQHLKVALMQADLVWQNAAQNQINFSKKIDEITESVDLIVLPEMFTTGFSMQPQKIAEYMIGDTVEWMQKIASEKNTAIAGSVIISENNKYYNRFLFIHPSGKIEYYNKRHLFTLAGEHTVYSSGDEKKIIEYKGWKICPLVCYDLRFPVWARNIEEYDILMYVANWPKPRITAWDTLLKARSIENMCYTIGVNRVGKDANNLEYSGHSGVYNCLGEEVVKATPNKEETVIAILEKNHITETRNKLNFLSDKDLFELKG